MATVDIKQVKKSYGDVDVIHGIDLEILDGEFVVFVGPSGCGKSTLLRMIAGLEEITSGEIKIGDRLINDISPSKRGVAMVFQTYALYPHMTVYKNMAFGLKQAKTDPAEIDRRVREAAETLQITEYLDRTPKALSGGQRQRVAIGRAIVRDPEVFLFDEPLSNLDAALRGQTRIEIAKLHERLQATMIYVTHDQVEAMTLADKIVVLNKGLIEQIGKPMDLYNKPNNLFVASFIGSPKMNLFDCDASKGVVSIGGTKKLKAGSNSTKITVGIRPEHLVSCQKASSIVSGKLDLIEQLGDIVIAHLTDENGFNFTVKMDEAPEVNRGGTLHFNLEKDRAHFFDTNTGLRI